MVLDRIKAMLEEADGDRPPFPPTLLFNENWLLRLVLDWYARGAPEGELLTPADGAGWYSEAWLPSAFLPRARRDRLAESWTHADGVIGHFIAGNHGTADLALLPDADQFVVVEGKMFSRLSGGVKNSPGYDQAARTVACMAEVLRRAGRRPDEIDMLAYVLIAPRSRIEAGAFDDELTAESIGWKVRRRVDAYRGDRDAWHDDWFVPTLEKVVLLPIAWEALAESIAHHDPEAGQTIDSFYTKCLHFGRPQAVPIWFPAKQGHSPSNRDERVAGDFPAIPKG
ncbi:MAG: hypothetical protein U0800_15355 [Isosphaeraceae bacterium]